MPCPGPFHLSYSVDYIYDCCPLPDPDVGISIFVCDVEHTSILVCAAASLSCACLVSVQVSAPYVIAGSTQELYICLFRQMARLLLKISRCLAYVHYLHNYSSLKFHNSKQNSPVFLHFYFTGKHFVIFKKKGIQSNKYTTKITTALFFADFEFYKLFIQ